MRLQDICAALLGEVDCSEHADRRSDLCTTAVSLVNAATLVRRGQGSSRRITGEENSPSEQDFWIAAIRAVYLERHNPSHERAGVGTRFLEPDNNHQAGESRSSPGTSEAGSERRGIRTSFEETRRQQINLVQDKYPRGPPTPGTPLFDDLQDGILSPQPPYTSSAPSSPAPRQRAPLYSHSAPPSGHPSPIGSPRRFLLV